MSASDPARASPSGAPDVETAPMGRPSTSFRVPLSDRMTQWWVWATGQEVSAENDAWLAGPWGSPQGIGGDVFDRWARTNGLRVERAGSRGLLPSLDLLAGPGFDPAQVHRDVRRFYERTSDYELEAWCEWNGALRPFGWLLSRIFSRRLQQLNVPLTPLDTSEGTTSEVVHLVGPDGGLVMAAWIRHLKRSGDVLYAGAYSVAQTPGHENPCVKVVFPLPNGNAMVFLKASVDPLGALTVLSSGRRFGDPGFYFSVRSECGRTRARYVRTIRESIEVYPAGNGEVRANHVMRIFDLVFLRLHYRLRPLDSR